MLFDLIIRGGMIADGTGKDSFKADIGVRGDRIEAIGDLSAAEAAGVIDASGCAVTPGFIEPHSHADLNILFDPGMESYLMQGVTTVVGGNCGHGMAPIGDEVYRSAIVDFRVVYEADPSYFNLVKLMVDKDPAARALKKLYNIDLDWHTYGEYIDKCNQKGMGANIAPLIGYSAVRNAVMGKDCLREATLDEIARMEQLVDECMKEGAFGISTGRDMTYIPGPYATDEETVRMLRIAKNYGGIFSSHTYNVDLKGSPGRMEGYVEMLEQAKAAGIRANVSHVHVMGMAATPGDALKAARDTLAYFEKMEAEGLDLSYDVIPSPYSADFTIPYFAFLLRPFVLMSGSRRQLAENFKIPDFREMVHKVISMYQQLDPSFPGSIYPFVAVLRHANADYVGKNLLAFAKEREADPLDLVMDLFAGDPDMEANVTMSGFEEANDLLCRHRMAMPCADGVSCSKDTNFSGFDETPLYPNAMTISFIPRFLTVHAKERFEDTVRQISGYPAERFGIEGRGVIKEGNYADLVVLDRGALRSHDMDEDFLQYPEGYRHVIVNGVETVRDKKMLGAMAGKMLRKPV